MSGTQFLPAEQTRLPLLPLRDVVVFPRMVIPLFVGRPKSVKALEAVMEAGKSIMLVAQKTAAKDEPTDKDLYEVGCIANILQMLKLPDGTVKVLIEDTQRASILSVTDNESHFFCEAVPVGPEPTESAEAEALRRAIVPQFDRYVKLNRKIPPEILTSLSGIGEPGRLANTIAAHLPIKLEQKQKILEMFDVTERLESLLSQLEGEIDILRVEERIRDRVKRQMEKSQHGYYPNEQVKAVRKELGEDEEGADLGELDKKIKAARMPKEAKKKTESEFKKLKLISPMSAEATVVHNYIDTLVGLSQRKKSKVNNDLSDAEQVLDQGHYGLEKVKERILEYLTVQQHVDKLRASILCLVGSPGVGKTSLGQSVARATSRKFVRMVLGGVRDEAEIRGHHRTYIDSMPGKILQSLTKVGVRSPPFLLDEVDKMGVDFRGDPSFALLEVLDPEQNHMFQDHYIEVGFDLSDVMFVTTSNPLNILAPLLDRMEMIRLSGYTEDEKVNIARRYPLPKQIKNNGLKEGEIEVTEAALRDIIRYYAREAGVRSLEREVSKICRKVVKQLLPKKEANTSVEVDSDNLDKFLGVRRFDFGLTGKEDQVGQVAGLAWIEVGGDLLIIEAALIPGKDNITHTGSLGGVMKGSVGAARSVVRSRSVRLGIKDEMFEKRDTYTHVPEGATPKDGSSTGIAMTTALVSVLTGILVRADVAMTGEITLRSEVLSIGGSEEKLLTVHRGGIKLALIPEKNVKDLADTPDNVKNSIEIQPARWIDKVLELVSVRKPEPLPEEEAKPVPAQGDDGKSQEMVHH